MLASVKSTTNVSLPSELKAKAIELNIPFSSTLEDALRRRIEDSWSGTAANHDPHQDTNPITGR